MALLVTLGLPAGCEPERGIAASRDFARPIAVNCVDRAFRRAFPNLQVYRLESDGNDRFPAHSAVRQWAYWIAPDYRGTSRFALARAGSGSRIVHEFTGAGTAIPQPDFRSAVRAMVRANAAVSASCGLDLHGMGLEEIGQRADLLH